MLIEKSERIALQQERAAWRPNLKLVVSPCAHSGQKQFPDPATEKEAHRIRSAIPTIEIAHHAHSLGVRRPDREINPSRTLNVSGMRAEFFVNLQVIPLGEKMQVD